jgi:hypothetical protein
MLKKYDASAGQLIPPAMFAFALLARWRENQCSLLQSGLNERAPIRFARMTFGDLSLSRPSPLRPLMR